MGELYGKATGSGICVFVGLLAKSSFVCFVGLRKVRARGILFSTPPPPKRQVPRLLGRGSDIIHVLAAAWWCSEHSFMHSYAASQTFAGGAAVVFAGGAAVL